MGRLGMGEILIILVIVLVLFGATRLPQLGSSLGQAIRNFKRGFTGLEEDEPAPGETGKTPGRMAAGTGVAQESDTRSKVASKEG